MLIRQCNWSVARQQGEQTGRSTVHGAMVSLCTNRVGPATRLFKKEHHLFDDRGVVFAD